MQIFGVQDFYAAGHITYYQCVSLLITMIRTYISIKKVKASHTRYRALGPELTPMYRQSAHR